MNELTDYPHSQDEEKEKETEKRETAIPAIPALCSTHHSLGWELRDISSCQEVHHRSIALLRGKQLSDLHVSASARSPFRCLPHRCPEYFLLVFPPAAVAEEVLLRLGHPPFTQPAFVFLSATELFSVGAHWCMPTHTELVLCS
jgi:hypothetical protein